MLHLKAKRLHIAFVLLIAIFLCFGTDCRASFPIKKTAQYAHVDDTTNVNTTPNTPGEIVNRAKHLSFHDRLRLLKDVYRLRHTIVHSKRSGNNDNGLASVVLAGLSTLLLIAAIASTAFASSTLSVALFILWPITAIVAIVLGAIGISRDRKPAMGITGMIIGIVNASLFLAALALILFISAL